MHRHALTDEQWELLEPLIPQTTAKTGRPAKDRRLMLDGILWVLATGAPWRDLPERFGSCKTVHRYFTRWRAVGIFERILNTLQIRLDEKGLIDWELWCVDGASVRASRAAGGADKKVSSDIPTNPTTTHWADHAVDSARNSIWSLTAVELPLRSKSRPARCTNQPAANRRWPGR